MAFDKVQSTLKLDFVDDDDEERITIEFDVYDDGSLLLDMHCCSTLDKNDSNRTIDQLSHEQAIKIRDFLNYAISDKDGKAN
ncbi:MAG: hypothetical protein WC856_02645 [Methylococcaceae bacterium]|jgi:hypothetical protein